MKFQETTVIQVHDNHAAYVADYPSLGEARAQARTLDGGEVVPAYVWHEGEGWFEWARSGRSKADKQHRRGKRRAE